MILIKPTQLLCFLIRNPRLMLQIFKNPILCLNLADRLVLHIGHISFHRFVDLEGQHIGLAVEFQKPLVPAATHRNITPDMVKPTDRILYPACGLFLFSAILFYANIASSSLSVNILDCFSKLLTHSRNASLFTVFNAVSLYTSVITQCSCWIRSTAESCA